MAKPDRPVKKFNGLALLAAMFREFDPLARAKMSEKLGAVSPILLGLVDRCDFIYSDLARLDPTSLQRLLVKFPEDDWVLAWKMTSGPLRQQLVECMPDRRKAKFLELVKSAPKVPKTRVIRVQVRIAIEARRMLMLGQLALMSRRGRKKGLPTA
jgi:flagellar motor switch protein FliG